MKTKIPKFITLIDNKGRKHKLPSSMTMEQLVMISKGIGLIRDGEKPRNGWFKST